MCATRRLGYRAHVLLYGRAPKDETTIEMRRFSLPPGSSADTAGRRVTATLRAWGWEDVVDEAVEVVAALAAPADQGADHPLELWLRRDRCGVTVELHCAGEERFHPLLTDDVDRARRIRLLDGLVGLWGLRPLAAGDAVWFELR